MTTPTMRSTSLLTEHLGYPPISLVDDIINAVNEIMYKCTNAMEKYLMERNTIGSKDYSSEIKIGTAKLESLLENSIDRNFDKLELYVLRNILSIPSNLMDENRFKLLHHEHLVLIDEESKSQTENSINEKLKEISDQLELNRLLVDRINTTNELLYRVIQLKRRILELLRCEDPLTKDLKQLWSDLKPLDGAIKLTTSRLKQIYWDNEQKFSVNQVERLSKRYNELKNTSIVRNGYIERKSQHILDSLNIDVEQSDSLFTSVPPSEDNSESIIDHPDWASIQKFT